MFRESPQNMQLNLYSLVVHLLSSVSSLCLTCHAFSLRHFKQNHHTDCDLYKRKARYLNIRRKRKRDGASESELKVIDWKNRLRGATAEDIREESCSLALFLLASFCYFLLVWVALSFLSPSLFPRLFHTSFPFFVS